MLRPTFKIMTALIENTAPTIEPVTRNELKAHLRLNTAADAVSMEQIIAPNQHAIIAAYGLLGTGVSVAGYSATIYLDSGDCTGATVTVKLQESNDNATWTDITGGAFTAVTSANDNAVQEYEYTGSYAYVRAVATVASAVAEFSVSVVLQSLTTDENDWLDNAIKAARQYAEIFCNRSFIDTVWAYYLDDFKSEILLPRARLDSVTSIKYYDTANVQQTITSTYYDVDAYSEPARIREAYGYTWPYVYERMNAVEIIYKSGYGTATTDVPAPIRQAILLLAGHFYEHREAVITGTITKELEMTTHALLWPYRVF